MLRNFFATSPAAGSRQLGHAVRAAMGPWKTIALVACLWALLLGGLSPHARSATPYQVVSADEGLALFSNAIEQAGLSEKLKEAGPLTFFIPSDQAMANEGSAFLLEGVLLTKPAAEQLADLVLHHIVPAKLAAPVRLEGIDLSTLANVPLRVDRVGKGMLVGGWAVVTDRKVADNGIVYVIDRLLWPRDWQVKQDVAARARGDREAPCTGTPETARSLRNTID